MVRSHPRGHCTLQACPGLDDEQRLAVLLDLAFPSVHAGQPRNNVDTGNEFRFNESSCQILGSVRRSCHVCNGEWLVRVLDPGSRGTEGCSRARDAFHWQTATKSRNSCSSSDGRSKQHAEGSATKAQPCEAVARNSKATRYELHGIEVDKVVHMFQAQNKVTTI